MVTSLKKAHYILTLFFLLLSSRGGTAQRLQIDEVKAGLQTFIQRFEEHAGHAQGGAIAIVFQNQVIYRKTFGHKKGSAGNVGSQTHFPVCSVSKPISAALVAYLVKTKKLSLDDKIKSLNTNGTNVRLRDILSHSSGYADPGIGDQMVESGKNRKQAVDAILKKSKKQAKPGTSYSYSNVLFSLVEDLIEQKTRKSYKQNMAEFLAQIGISRAGICGVNMQEDIAFPHVHSESLVQPERYPKTVCASAGLFLSIDDLSAFLKLSLGHYPKVLSASAFTPYFQPKVRAEDIFKKWHILWPLPISDMKAYYDMGWRTLERKSDPAARLLFHSGYLKGAVAFIGLIPESELGIVIVVNERTPLAINEGFDFFREVIQLRKDLKPLHAKKKTQT